MKKYIITVLSLISFIAGAAEEPAVLAKAQGLNIKKNQTRENVREIQTSVEEMLLRKDNKTPEHLKKISGVIDPLIKSLWKEVGDPNDRKTAPRIKDAGGEPAKKRYLLRELLTLQKTIEKKLEKDEDKKDK